MLFSTCLTCPGKFNESLVFLKCKLLLPALEEVLRTVVHHSSPHAITKSIPLSDDTVQRIDEMAEDLKKFFCDF